MHLLIIFRILPSDIVWGGQDLDETTVMYMEIFAVFLSIFFILIIAARMGYFQSKWFQKAAKIIIWLMVVYFALNFLGNIMAETMTEKLIGIPSAFIIALCSFRLAIKK